MASEDPIPDAPPEAAAASPPPAGEKQHNYPEMIMAAIEATDYKVGILKPIISKFIEANYTDLPPTHSALLTHHLNQMKLRGEIVQVKNNYMKPDPSAPPRRGRGRPPKPKPDTPAPAPAPAAAAVASSPRPRGRPPKPKDPLAPPAPAKAPAVAGRKRGRPPKKGKAQAAAPKAAAADGTVVKRGRGRPPKVKPAVSPVGA